ncbi:MAG: hypothetical protein GF309_07595 [Candidatus Lokiarchaeota archaeon]|nr:hypothetical protein [Candidatus Lokiarchaeota archaeon]
MQITIPAELLTYLIIGAALLIQFMWMWLIRKGRDFYLRDIAHLRKPSGTLSKYYHWRISKIRNAVGEGVAFELILIAGILGISYLISSISALLQTLPIVLMVTVLSLISIIQGVRRVRRLTQEEQKVLGRLEKAEYKVEEVRDIVDNLAQAGKEGSGETWFVLFKLATKQTPIGVSIREVLQERAKQLSKKAKKAQLDLPLKEESEGDKGPAIEFE